MKRIYFMRHGQSQANTQGVYAGGAVNTPLTEEGLQQARQAAQSALKLNIQLIISSDLDRAYESAKIIAGELKLPSDKLVTDKRLREVYLGKLEGSSAKGWDGYAQYAEDENNGMRVESLKSLLRRVKEIVDYVSTREEDNILLVGHNGSGIALRSLFNVSGKIDSTKIPSAEIIELAGAEKTNV